MWPIPLGQAHAGKLAQTLGAAGPKEFAPIAACPGCVRHDYAMTLGLFRRSLPGLVLQGLKLAGSRTLRGNQGSLASEAQPTALN